MFAAAGNVDGTFLIRRRPGADEYVLSVVYKGGATHHLVKKDAASGVFKVNNKSFGNCTSLEAVCVSFVDSPSGV